MRVSFILLSVFLAIFLTLVTTRIQFFKGSIISTSPYSYDTLQGFPFSNKRSFSRESVILPSMLKENRVSPILVTFIFWFIGSFSLLTVLNQEKKTNYLILSVMLAVLLMLIDLSTSPYCVKGYPIEYIVACNDVIPPPGPSLLYAGLNSLFWLVVSFTTISIYLFYLRNLQKRILFKLIFPALLLTVLSFSFQTSCSSFFCFAPSGRGFPLAYTSESKATFFGIDFAFWFFVANFIALFSKALHKARK